MVMLLAAAFFTPQAASASPASSPRRKSVQALAFVFIGWSFALALGVPTITAIARRYGWQVSYIAIGLTGLACFVFLTFAVPPRFMTAPVNLKTWSGCSGRCPF
jgi:MFS transporter, DHA1 family, inner membrane transport protein